MRLNHALIALSCVTLVTLHDRAAGAYPTSVIFAPTGDAKDGGDVGTLFYSSMVFTKPLGPSLSWFGFTVQPPYRLDADRRRDMGRRWVVW